MQLIMFVPFHFLAYIPFNVLLPGESNPGHTAYAVGIPQSSESIIHTRPYLLLPVLSPPRSVANLKSPLSTFLGVTTPHHSFPPPALRSNLRFEAFSKRPPSGGHLPYGIHARQVFSEPYKTQVPSRPLFPAVASNSFKSFECLGGNFHLSCHVPRYASFPVIFFTLLTGGTVRTTTFCH